MIKVAVVEDDRRYRESLETLFRVADDFELVRMFPSAESLLAEIGALARSQEEPPWDLAVVDIQLPGTDGLEATRRLKAYAPDLPVAFLTVFEDPAVIVEGIAAGADGYLLKKAGPHELLEGLRSIASGTTSLTPAVARHLLEWVREREKERRPAGPSPDRLDLTAREQDVLRCLVQGLSYAGCAEQLGISFETVRTHVRRIYRKLQVHNVAAAVRKAVRRRLV